MNAAISKASTETNQRYSWRVMIVVWIAGMMAPMNMAKVTTLAPVLMESFGITESGIGWVIATFYILGVIIAFPAANICNKIGLKITIISSLVLGIIGGLIGAISTNLSLFMVSRIIEGTSMGVMAVAGAAAISPWFPNSKKGLPLSIWGLWVSVPSIIFPLVYSALTESTGTWKTSWYIAIAFSMVALVLFALFYRTPNFVWDENENPVLIDKLPVEEQPKGSVRAAFKVPAFWGLMAIVLIDGAGFMGMNGFWTTYLTGSLGVSLSQATIVVSLGAVVGAIISPVAGALSDKIGSCKILLFISVVFAVITMWFIFSVQSYTGSIIIAVINGLYCGIMGATTWGMIGKMLPDEAISGGTAGMSFFQNGGFFVGAVVFGYLIEAMGGMGAAMHMVIVPCYIVALIILLVFWKRMP